MGVIIMSTRPVRVDPPESDPARSDPHNSAEQNARPDQAPGDAAPPESDGGSTAEAQDAREASDKLDASVLQALLNEAFAPYRAEPVEEPAAEPFVHSQEPEDEPETEAAKPRKGAARKWTGRIIKTLIGLAILVFAVWTPVRQLFQVSSAEAIVNAPVVTLRSPIDGVVTFTTAGVGDSVGEGDVLVRVANPNADLTGLDDATRAVQDSLERRDLLVARIESLEAQRADLEAQLESFREGRIAILTARLGNPDLPGWQRTETEIELAALREGAFLGDSYNDRPSSAQRLDQIAIDLANAEAELNANLARYPRLLEAEGTELVRANQASRAAIVAPGDGSIWELLASEGEQVRAGQDIVRLLDCSRALVSAVVSESTYNQLDVGMAARFTYRDGGESVVGEVVQLAGVAAAPGNLAISPAALQADSFRVTLSVPAIAAGDSCAVGRTGRVVFDQ